MIYLKKEEIFLNQGAISMFSLITLCLILLLTPLIVILLVKFPKKRKPIIYMLGILLFGVYIIRLFSYDNINYVFNLLLIDIDTPINSEETWLFSVNLSVFIIILRWLTIVLIAWVLVNIVYEVKELKILISFIGPIVVILNIVFFNEHLIAFQGNKEFSIRAVQYIVETALLGSIVFSTLYFYIKKKGQQMNKTIVSIQTNNQKKSIYSILLIIIGSMFALMPQSFLFNLFGNYGSLPKDFNVEHIFVIFFAVVLTFVGFQFMKNRTQNSKNAFIFFLALAAVFQYFYTRRETLSALPLHLCNLAIILIFISTLFNVKGLFYFAYFANVIGAILAILLPNYTTEDFFNITVIHFGYNHLYAFSIPILAVALGRFEKPNLKAMFQAIAVFTVYFIVIIFLNAWFNNYATVDYFFAYSDFLTSKFDFSFFSMSNVQYQNVISFNINNLEFKFFWLFKLIYYFGFVFIMFLSWYVYDLVFITIDNHKKLKSKLKNIKNEHLILLEHVGKKGLKNRMKEQGANMIKIENFSKKYGKSKKYAVKDFTLEVKKGEIFGFLGHNGAGKSTTIKSLVGIQTITEGEMFIDGFSIKTQPIEAKLRIGYVSDNHAVYENLTGREYIHYVADLYLIDKQTRNSRLKMLSERLNLDHALDQEVKTYSHGMKQKLVVIASLIHEPPVWILDEPLTGLDPTSAYQIKETMKEYAKRGNIVFFSSHVIEVVEKICTKIAIINEGELQGIYDMKDLIKAGVSLENLYLTEKETKE